VQSILNLTEKIINSYSYFFSLLIRLFQVSSPFNPIKNAVAALSDQLKCLQEGFTIQ